MRSTKRLLAMMLLGGVMLPVPAGALLLRHEGGGEDRLGIFETMVVEPDAPAADVACVFCTIEVRGKVNGDLAALFSTVRVEDGQEIAGDVAGLFSTLRLGDGAQIGGDLAWGLGSSSMGDGAQVRGDREMLGSGVSWAVVAAPLLIAIGVVWLLVALVRRVV